MSDAVKAGGVPLPAAVRVEERLARIEALEPAVQAWAHFDPALVRAQAQRLDAEQERKEAEGSADPAGPRPLWGWTVGLKDIIDTADWPTENGTVLHAGRRPSEDAWIVQRLKAAGAVLMGKTVTTELATYAPGKTRNPHSLSRQTGHTPGGSSSGSAAAVACGMVDAAIGTQTNGSVIRPGAFCGVAAFKPSRHTLPRAGVLVQSPTFDTLGLFAPDVPRLRTLFHGLTSSTPDAPIAPIAPIASSAGLDPARLAWWPTPFWPRTEALCRPVWEQAVAALGVNLNAYAFEVDRWLPAEDIVALHRLIMEAEIGRAFRPEYERGAGQLSASLCGQIERGLATSDAQWQAAQAELSALKATIDAAWPEGLDALLLPAAPGPAPEGLASTGDPIFCTVGTALDLPAIQVPGLRAPGTGQPEQPGLAKLPLGLQLLGRRGTDAKLLDLAIAVETAIRSTA